MYKLLITSLILSGLLLLGSPIAAEDGVFCGNLSESDCLIYQELKAFKLLVPAEFESEFMAAFAINSENLGLDEEVDLELDLAGRYNFSDDLLTSLSEDMTGIDLNHESLVELIASNYQSFAGEIKATFTSSSFGELQADLWLVDGIGYIALDVGDPDLTQVFAVDLADLLSLTEDSTNGEIEDIDETED